MDAVFQGVASEPVSQVMTQNTIGSMFLLVQLLFCSTNYPVMVIFGLEKPVFMREI